MMGDNPGSALLQFTVYAGEEGSESLELVCETCDHLSSRELADVAHAAAVAMHQLACSVQARDN
jgi:hypothetical protein